MRLAAVLCAVLLLFSCSKKETNRQEIPQNENQDAVNLQAAVIGITPEQQAERDRYLAAEREQYLAAKKAEADAQNTQETQIELDYYRQWWRPRDPVVTVRSLSASWAQTAENLIDFRWKSWNVGNSGIGQSFTLFLIQPDDPNYPDSSAKTVAGFTLKNGNGNINLIKQNNRVKTFSIYADGRHIETITVKDSIFFESYSLQTPVECRTIRFVIEDVYPGTNYHSLDISEIALFRRAVDFNELQENIIFWLDKGEDSPSSFRTYEEDIVGLANAIRYRQLNNNFDDDEYKRHYDATTEEYIKLLETYGGKGKMASVADTDKILLLDYLPYDITTIVIDDGAYIYRQIESKIKLLDEGATLRLNDNLPRLDGATAMYPLYSAFVRAVYPERAIGESYTQGRADNNLRNYLNTLLNWYYLPSLDLLKGTFYSLQEDGITEADFKSIVQCNTTSNAYQRLIDGKTDIIFCYEPSQEQINAAAAKGLRFNMTPIAKDAFVFIVNERNILNNITEQQIRDIYSGRVTNWQSISGADEQIIAYQREENSGSQSTLQAIMKGDTIMRPIVESEWVSTSSMFGLVRAITSTYYNYNAAIGYTFLFYLNDMAGNSGTKILSVNGAAPNPQNIRNGSYPFAQTVYAITTGNESENTKKFIEWILSAQGQELVRRTGYTPVR
jgi:phosphate transport system substrate-binding protein